MTHFLRAALALACLLTFAPAAGAAYQYVPGQQDAAGPDDGVCPGIGILASAGYFRNEANREPRANEAFYVEVKLTYFESFDCAAAFTGIQMTLPNGLVPAPGAQPLCKRVNLATGALDPRTAANCPVGAPPHLGGNTYSLDPVATNHPESQAFGRKFWFQGYDSRTNGTYRVMAIQVPVSAATAVTGPVTFTMKRFDAVNTWNASVNVTTTGSPQPPNGGTYADPKLSVQNAPGQFQISPIGVEIPFSVTKGSTPFGLTEYVVKGTDLNQPAYPACANGEMNEGDFFSTDEAFLNVFGDFSDYLRGPGDPPICDLEPSTTFTSEFCIKHRNATNTMVYNPCATTTFTTPPVDAAVDIAESATDARVATFTLSLRGAWPAGAASVQLRRPGGSFANLAGGTFNATRGTGAATLGARQVNDLVPWQEHAVQACFDPTAVGPPTACVNAVTLFPGAIEAPADVAIANTTATVSGVKLRAPNPAMTVQLRARKATDGATQSPADLPVIATSAVGAGISPGTTAVGDIVAGGLAANTKYVWTVCAETDGDAAPEKCSPGDSFTTGNAPVVVEPTPNPSTSPTGSPTASPSATPTATTTPGDTVKPTAKLTVKGKSKRRKRVTLTVTASDASGIRSVTIKVGAKKAVAKRKLSVKLPAKKGRLKIVVTVTDNSGNVTVVRRTLKVT